MRVLLLIIFCAIAWANFGTDAATVAPSKLLGNEIYRITFIGNSLTLHTPKKELGWSNSWGMAASAQDRDYAHRTGAALGLPVSVFNLAALESDPENNLSRIAEVTRDIRATTVVVVELGDNVQPASQEKFIDAYERLLDAAKGLQLICLSTWWKNEPLDRVLEQQCVSHGGRYVHIGDIRADAARLDAGGPQFSDPGVNAHPHDSGMAMISERIVAAVRSFQGRADVGN
ncbi:alpha-galactosidase [Variovorax boronicumulans]|uniref:hypothetical protein n=1 Tax=Variovorax boronicumulans TaxID=436515 RepID=UPI003398206F